MIDRHLETAVRRKLFETNTAEDAYGFPITKPVHFATDKDRLNFEYEGKGQPNTTKGKVLAWLKTQLGEIPSNHPALNTIIAYGYEAAKETNPELRTKLLKLAAKHVSGDFTPDRSTAPGNPAMADAYLQGVGNENEEWYKSRGAALVKLQDVWRFMDSAGRAKWGDDYNKFAAANEKIVREAGNIWNEFDRLDIKTSYLRAMFGSFDHFLRRYLADEASGARSRSPRRSPR